MQENEKIKSIRVHDKVFTYQTLVGMGMWLFALQQELQKKPNIQEQARIAHICTIVVFPAPLGPSRA